MSCCFFVGRTAGEGKDIAMGEKLDRRGFLKGGIWGVAGMGLLGAMGAKPLAALAAEAIKPAVVSSKLALVRNPKVVTAPVAFDKSLIDEMLARAVCLLSGEKNPKDAWAKLINPSKSDVIGLKVNNLGGNTLRTAPELTYAVAKALQSIGVPKGNIIIWDRGTKELGERGYQVNKAAGDVRCFGTDPDRGFSERASKMGDKEIHLTKILTEDISILINMPVMKDHSLAGITGAMKNHYGSFKNVWRFHDNNCDPHIANLNNIPEIRDKTRLVVFDAMRPLFDGGPGDRDPNRWNFGGICVSQDPVANDALAVKVIDARRKLAGLDSVAERAKHIQTAAKLGLGCADLANVKILGDSPDEA